MLVATLAAGFAVLRPGDAAAVTARAAWLTGSEVDWHWTPEDRLGCGGTLADRMLRSLDEARLRGLELTENPAVDPVDHFTHNGNSLHYQLLGPGLGRAVDIYGTPEELGAYTRWALACFGVSGVTQLFYDPIGGWADGHDLGPIGGHSDHVHIGF